MHKIDLSFVFTIIFSATMLAIGFWMALAPRSYLTLGVSWWRLFAPNASPESRSTQLACRIVGIGIIAIIAVYDAAVL